MPEISTATSHSLLIEVLGTMIGVLLAYAVIQLWDVIRGALAVILGGVGAVSLAGIALSAQETGTAWIFAAALICVAALLWFLPSRSADRHAGGAGETRAG